MLRDDPLRGRSCLYGRAPGRYDTRDSPDTHNSIASFSSKKGDEVQGVVIAPVLQNEQILIP
ncbi:MAG: hypothetical protein M3Y24_02150, partial [Acidobacteriota bacterium]|nr:hypothetical protein [Acidobacteriota bacterium]